MYANKQENAWRKQSATVLIGYPLVSNRLLNTKFEILRKITLSNRLSYGE